MLLLSLLTLLGAIAVGAISPGPSFIFVVRTAVAGSRRAGLAAALGMGVGGMIFSILVLLGLNVLLAKTGWVFVACKAAGAIYLIVLAVGVWRDAGKPLADDGAATVTGPASRGVFLRALLVQLSNPKAIVVYGSIFAALLPRDLPTPVAIVLPGLIFLIEAGWYAFVALMLSSAPPRHAYLRWKSSLDRLAAGVLGALGVKLLLNARSGG